MKFKTTPYQHQLEEFNATKDLEAWGLRWEQGTGKTKTVIDTATYLYLQGKISAMLVIAPNGVAQNWAFKEIVEHLPDLEGKGCFVALYEAKRAKTKYHKAECKTALDFPDLSIMCITYDGLMTKAGSAYAKKFLEKRRCLFVLDESHRCKTPGAKRTQRIVAWGKKAPYRRIMTGTPITVNPWDIWTQIKFLDPVFWLSEGFGSLQSFKTYFAEWETGTRFNQKRGRVQEYPVLKEYRNLEQLGEILSKISSRVKKEDVLDLPPRTFTQRFVEMSTEQKKMYNKLRSEFFIELDQGDQFIPVPFAMSRLQKFQQILLGFLMDDGKVVHEFDKNPRLDLLCDMLEHDIDGQVIIWANYTRAIDHIMERLGDAVRYDGQVKARERVAAIDRFQSGGSRFFVGNQASGGTGLTLTAGTTMVYYSNSNRPEDRWQSLDRNHRIGQTKNTTVIDLIGGPVDQKTLEGLKQNTQMAKTINRDELKEWV